MRALLLVSLVTAGCDYYIEDEEDDDRPGGAADGGMAPLPDAGDDGCSSWALELAPIESMSMMDPGPYEVGTSARVLVSTSLGECDERAMPLVTEVDEGAGRLIEMRVWRRVQGPCDGERVDIARPVLIEFSRQGPLVIESDSPPPIEIDVLPRPTGMCGAGGECRRDCDCTGDERCLTADGLGGPTNSCHRPCELDRDCGGEGTCIDIGDGPSRVCAGLLECVPEDPCPGGWSCSDGGACTPDFTLGEETRIACGCDADCAQPLRCVRARPDEEGRCQVACPTAGDWCEGAHFCGARTDDAADLATTDSVCVWAGE